MAAKSNAFQFARLQGFHKGPPSKRDTVGSLIAEGLRHPTHISHILGAPQFEVIHLDGPVSEPDALPAWIEDQMARAQNPMMFRGRKVLRGVRNDALAIGTLIASLPETMDEFDPERYAQFTEDTTQWAREFLSVAKMQLHFRLEHLDELHPHLHLWFTPKGVEEGDGTWSFSSVLGRNKGFLHKFQMNFFEEVGHKYSEFRARPMEDRQKRVPRHFAVQRRDAETQDIVGRISEGDISAIREAGGQNDPVDIIGKMLDQLNDADLDHLPAINRRLLFLREEKKFSELERLDLEEQVRCLEVENLELKDSLKNSNNRSDFGDKENIKIVSQHNDIRAGVNKFLVEGVWMIIVESILDSARRNLNRSFHITKKEWRLLVVDDAISYIEPSVSNCNVEQTKFWINKAIKGYYHLEKNGSSRGFEAFEKIEISCDPDTDEIDFIENNDMKKGLEL